MNPSSASCATAARLVDSQVKRAWRLKAGAAAEGAALLAVGGYGRGELLPCSDIDVMVLLPQGADPAWTVPLEQFLSFLWDIGLETGHSVRTIDDCQREALADLSVATTLFEARLLDGEPALFDAMRRALALDRLWSSRGLHPEDIDSRTAILKNRRVILFRINDPRRNDGTAGCHKK